MPFKACEWLDKVNKGEGTQIFVCCLGCDRVLDMVVKNSSFLCTKSVLF